MLVWPAHRNTPMVVLRSAAMTCGIATAHLGASSSNVTSRTQWDLFSMCQWPRRRNANNCPVSPARAVKTGDPVDDFDPFRPRFFGDDMAPNLKDLC